MAFWDIGSHYLHWNSTYQIRPCTSSTVCTTCSTQENIWGTKHFFWCSACFSGDLGRSCFFALCLGRKCLEGFVLEGFHGCWRCCLCILYIYIIIYIRKGKSPYQVVSLISSTVLLERIHGTCNCSKNAYQITNWHVWMRFLPQAAVGFWGNNMPPTSKLPHPIVGLLHV